MTPKGEACVAARPDLALRPPSGTKTVDEWLHRSLVVYVFLLPFPFFGPDGRTTVLYLLFGVWLFTRRSGFRLTSGQTLLAWPLLVYLLIAGLSVAASPYPRLSIREFQLGPLNGLILFLLLARDQGQVERLRRYFMALISASTLVTGYGIFGWLTGRAQIDGMLISVYRWKNTLGYMLAMSLTVVVWAVLVGRHAGRRVGWAMLGLLQLAVLLLSYTRAALVAVAISSGMLAVAFRRVRMLPIGAVVLAAFLVVGGHQIATRYLSIAQPSTYLAGTLSGRIELWQGTVAMIRRRPLLGYGFGSTVFPHVARAFAVQTGDLRAAHNSHAHNLFLEATVEMGLLGLAAVCALGGTVAWVLVDRCRRNRSADEPSREMALLLLGCYAVMAVISLTDYLLVGDGLGVLLWVLLACTGALVGHVDRTERGDRDRLVGSQTDPVEWRPARGIGSDCHSEGEARMRLLVLAIRALGDVVLTTPIYRTLKDAYPTGRLDVVVERPYGELLHGNPNLDAIYEVERGRDTPRLLSWSAQARLIAALRRKRYDVVVDLFSGPRSALMARLTGAPCRIGEDTRSRGRGWLYTHPIPVKREEEHLVVQKLRLVRPLVGEVQETPLELFVLPEELDEAEAVFHSAGTQRGRRRVGFFPGAGWAHKRWPPERFAALGDILAAEQGADIVLLGGANDGAACEAVAARMRHRPILLCGARPLRATAACIAQMDLFVSNDTGPMHMAVALNVPTIALYGPSNIVKYGPWGDLVQVVSHRLTCSPCPQQEETCHLVGRVPQECMLEISVEEVLGTVDRLVTAATEPAWAAGTH